MEFWGVEVKAGQALKVSPGEGNVIHLSHASIGDSKKGKGENIPVFAKVDEQKLVIGTLSDDKFPQIQYDIVFDKDFELSHNGKNRSVFFCGYKTQNHVDVEGYSGDEFESDSESDDEELPLENGKPIPAIAGPSNPMSATKAVKIEDVKADSDEDSSDEDDSDDDSDDDDKMDEDESSDDEEESSEEEDEKTPTPIKENKKRPTEAETKVQVSTKKSKLDKKNPAPAPALAPATAHTATPHPAKRFGKTPKNVHSKTPISAGKSNSKAKHASK